LNSFDITKYLQMALRRKWWIILPFLVTVLGGLGYLLVVPKTYEAETLVLVQRQKVPEDFVRAIVSSEVEDRLKTIIQQVTSRTNLERIIQDHQLYEGEKGVLTLDDKVNLVRKNITIDERSSKRGVQTVAFTIKFSGQDPRRTAEVTNSLASSFISENLLIRESQAIGTSNFLTDELDSVSRRLIEKEEQLKGYREKFMGGLPEQLETNLRILERLQAQLDKENQNLIEAQNRRVVTQKELAEYEKVLETQPTVVIQNGGTSEPKDLPGLKAELASLESRYTENHPDVIRIRTAIANLETGAAEKKEDGGMSTLKPTGPPSQTLQLLRRQLVDTEVAISTLKAETEKLKAQIVWYDQKVQETPKREQELLTLNRDYENNKALYESLLTRKLEADISVSMEKKQKGEQFRIIDSAKVPERPVKPDIQRVILMTLALGLGLGAALAYLAETMDTSYKSPEELEQHLKLPILVSMPIRYTNGELRRIKLKKALAFSSVGVGFCLSAAGIVIAVKGLDPTLSFVKQLLSKI
jgi:polysaccharide chain length determinant protein (PEP-CTERM system associated)